MTETPRQPTAGEVARMLGRMLRDRLAADRHGTSAHDQVEALDEFMRGLNDPAELESWVPLRADRYVQATGEHVPAEHFLYLNARDVHTRFCLCRAEDLDQNGHPRFELPEAFIEGRDGHVVILFTPDGDDPSDRVEWHFDGKIEHNYSE